MEPCSSKIDEVFINHKDYLKQYIIIINNLAISIWGFVESSSTLQ